MKKINFPKKKVLYFAIGGVVSVVAVIVGLFLFAHKKDEYRIIKVYKIEGEVLVTKSDIGEISAYENMILESGDRIKVLDGFLTLKLDEDKYVYASENTEFELIATGTAKDSKTTINLLEGMITNDIQNKLSDKSYYEVNTPNATMSVRGTGFLVRTYNEPEDKLRYTDIAVSDGIVEAVPVNMDGTTSNQSKLLYAQEFARIYTDPDLNSYFVIYDELIKKYMECITRQKDYTEEKVKQLMEDIASFEAKSTSDDDSDKDNEKSDSDEKKQNSNNKKHQVVTNNEDSDDDYVEVSFMYKGKVFATQTVKKGDKVSKPSLAPSSSGSWDYDFSEPVDEDMDINWK